MFNSHTITDGIGTSVVGAKHSAEAIVLAGLNWTVSMDPVIVNGKVLENKRATVRSTDGKVLGIVSNHYKPVQNAEAFSFVDNVIDTGNVTYETAGQLYDGRVWMLANLPRQTILHEEYRPYICFSNSHDGEHGIKVCLTDTRVVCANTLAIALKNAPRTWTIRHTGDIDKKIEQAQDTLFKANTYFHDVLPVYLEGLAEINVTDKQVQDFVSKLFPINNDDTARVVSNMEEMREMFLKTYNEKPDLLKHNGCAYGLLGAVTDMVTHMAPRRTTATYEQNRFMNLMEGVHPIMNRAQALLMTV